MAFKVKRPRKVRKYSVLTLALAAGSTLLLCASIIRNGTNSHASTTVQTSSASTEPHIVSMVLLPTPSRAVEAGERISAIPMTYSQWSSADFSTGYLDDINSHQEKIALIPLPKLSPIPHSAVGLSLENQNNALEDIPSGMRAITVTADSSSGVEGLGKPGAYVDVILLKRGDNSESGLHASIISENVKILSITKSERSPLTHLTLLTSQHDALKIKTASSIGKLTFALRGTNDRTKTTSLAISGEHLFNPHNSANQKPAKFTGKATGPDGKTYVLSEDGRWVRFAGSFSAEESLASDINGGHRRE